MWYLIFVIVFASGLKKSVICVSVWTWVERVSLLFFPQCVKVFWLLVYTSNKLEIDYLWTIFVLANKVNWFYYFSYSLLDCCWSVEKKELSQQLSTGQVKFLKSIVLYLKSIMKKEWTTMEKRLNIWNWTVWIQQRTVCPCVCWKHNKLAQDDCVCLHGWRKSLSSSSSVRSFPENTHKY